MIKKKNRQSAMAKGQGRRGKKKAKINKPSTM
jgi:hypothetical protein